MKVVRDDLRPIVEAASTLINHRTLFECPFPAGTELSEWVTDSWIEAFEAAGRTYEECPDVCRREVGKSSLIVPFQHSHEIQLRSRHWRIKSQLLYACKHDVEYLFHLNEKSPGEIKRHVELLLEKDRFICAKREVNPPHVDRNSSY